MAAFSSMVQHQNSNQQTPSGTTAQPDMNHLYNYLQVENNCRNNSNPLGFPQQILAAAQQTGFLPPFPPRLPFNFPGPPFPINFPGIFNFDNEEDDGLDDNIKVELEDKYLWDKFSDCVNEMIITKSGRYFLILLCFNTLNAIIRGGRRVYLQKNFQGIFLGEFNFFKIEKIQ